MPFTPPARACSAAAPISRAHRPTPSRASGRRACGCSPRQRTRPACRSSPSAWTSAISTACSKSPTSSRSAPATCRTTRCSPRATGAAEYVLKEGNESVILCERGIRTFETSYRFTLDLMAISVLKELTHLPVIVDPSHAAGRRDLVTPMSLAAAAAGADGIIVEVHPQPDQAICDGPQQLVADEFADYLERVHAAAAVAGKTPSRTSAMADALV